MRTLSWLLLLGLGTGCSAAGDTGGAGGGAAASTASSSGAGGGSSGSSTASSSATASSSGSGGGASKWSCVGSVKWPPAQVTSIAIDITLKDGFTMTPLSGIAVKACKKDDPDCASPLSTTTSDANGVVSITVQIEVSGFDGYLDFSGGNVQPAMVFLGPPPLVHDYKSQSFFLLSKGDYASLYSAAGVTADPTRGAVRARTVDCFNQNAAGLTLAVAEADASSDVVYYVGPNPNGSATQTDDGGLVAAVNVPAGTATLTGTLVADMTKVAEYAVPVRAGTLTMLPLPPTPLP